MQKNCGPDSEQSAGNRSAARFFWAWLIVATAMSVTGNVAHAVLHAPAGAVGLAAGAALVPPVVLLAATHSVAVLVRTRATGFTYWCALLMTLALASCAFVLSFDALRSLAVTLGLPASIAWLWPCAIDVAIAQATLCLLSLSRRGVAPQLGGESVAGDVVAEKRRPRPSEARPPAANRNGSRAAAAAAAEEGGLGESLDTAAIQRWEPVAESLVRDGVTSKHPRLVATILAQREAGVPPSTIGRTHEVRLTTVGRILTAAEALTA
jgi:hypothetical protein